MDFHATLAAVTARLDREGCRWAVIGGVAMGFYGWARTTFDIDILVDGCLAERLAALLDDLGYRVDFQWEESTHLVPTRDDRCRLDILHAKRPHTQAMLSRAHRIRVDDSLAVPVVELEDLIGLKVQAMINDPERRRGELVDIRALLEAAAARGGCDMTRVREYFALFSELDELAELSKGLEVALA